MIKRYNQMSSLQKAAALMLSLPEDAASSVFAQLDPNEIKQLAEAMSSLDTVHPSVIEALVSDFADQMRETSTVQGGFEATGKLLSKFMPQEQLSAVMEEIRMWDKLGHIQEETLALYLRNEYPQTIAVILSRLTSQQSSKVLSFFPEPLAQEVIVRMLSINTIQPEVLSELESTLRHDFIDNLGRLNQKDPHELMAQIFNNLDPKVSEKYLTALDQRNPEAAERVRSRMFKFEHIAQMNTESIQSILKNISKTDLALALKGADASLKSTFTTAMSKRAAHMLEEDINSLGPVRVKDVTDAQKRIVNSAKELIESGAVRRGGEQEEQYIE